MERPIDGSRGRAGRAMRWAALPAAAAMLASCIAVPIPVPIPIVTGVRTGPAPTTVKEPRAAAPVPATTVRYDGARMSADEAEAYARRACADQGATLDTLTRAAPSAASAASPGQSTITYTCRQ